MPFYIRKSVSAGPFRFNFSKGGVGLSVGVKGLRVGVGPRGHYVHAGRGGLYYRASLGRAGQEVRRFQTSEPSRAGSNRPEQVEYYDSGVKMIEVDSGDVLEMRDERFGDLLDEMNAKQAQMPNAMIFGLGVIAIGILMVLLAGAVGMLVLILAIPAWAIGRWLDSYKRTSVLFYDLDDDAAEAYEALTRPFDDMMTCGANGTSKRAERFAILTLGSATLARAISCRGSQLRLPMLPQI